VAPEAGSLRDRYHQGLSHKPDGGSRIADALHAAADAGEEDA
jgi:hypothetical protein